MAGREWRRKGGSGRLESLRDADWPGLLERARSRTPLSHGGKSGSPIERVVLDGGETVVVKRCTRETDGFITLLRDDGRLPRLWASGVFDRMPPEIDHAMLAVLPEAEGWVVVMRDVGEHLIPPDHPITREEMRSIVSAADAMHAAFAGQDIADTCPLDDYLTPYLPRAGEIFPDEMPVIEQKWKDFAAVAAPDMVDLVAYAHSEPRVFGRMFAQCPATFVHGDLFPPNIGLREGGIVLLDWSFATMAPGPFEIAFLLLWSDVAWAATLAASRDDVLDDYREIAGTRCDDRTLGIGIIAAFAQSGPSLRERPDALEWWTSRVREELRSYALP